MPMKRMVLEMGMGTDLRGQDDTKAAIRAVRDALWHNSLTIADALGQPPEAMRIDVHVGTGRPEALDHGAIAAAFPYGQVTVHGTYGGMDIEKEDGTLTIMANACVVVSLDVPEGVARRGSEKLWWRWLGERWRARLEEPRCEGVAQ